MTQQNTLSDTEIERVKTLIDLVRCFVANFEPDESGNPRALIMCKPDRQDAIVDSLQKLTDYLEAITLTVIAQKGSNKNVH